MTSTPMLLAVAPNGARKQYKDHPALPITAQELAVTAESCLAAGAGMIHAHVRDRSNGNQHCLDASLYSEVFSAIRSRICDQLFLQATTEAVGLYNADEQMAMVRDLMVLEADQSSFGVSLAVRELMNESIDDAVINAFFCDLKNHNTMPQLIMYDENDRNRFQQLLADNVLPGNAYPCLFVLGRYSDDLESDPIELLTFLSDLTGVSSWMACAFGAREANVAKTAALLGGHMRIGYENNVLLANGELSKNNAELIAQSAHELSASHRNTPDAQTALEIMTPDW